MSEERPKIGFYGEKKLAPLPTLGRIVHVCQPKEGGEPRRAAALVVSDEREDPFATIDVVFARVAFDGQPWGEAIQVPHASRRTEEPMWWEWPPMRDPVEIEG